MGSELKAANPELSPRAGIAMLTLQIRAMAQEAAALEAHYTPIDHEAAKQQLRDRLAPLVEERERAFMAELESVRAESDQVMADARRHAGAIVAERERRVAAARLEAERVAAERAEAERAEAERAAAERAAAERQEAERLAAEAERLEVERRDAERLEVARLALAASTVAELAPQDEPVEPQVVDSVFAPIAETVDQPDVLSPSQVLAAQSAPSVNTLPVVASSPAPINVTIDADAFARVFATVFASLIEHRLVEQPTQMYMRPMMMEAPASAPAKQGFWSQARHPDVWLMGLATAIVLVVLAAWLV